MHEEFAPELARKPFGVVVEWRESDDFETEVSPRSKVNAATTAAEPKTNCVCVSMCLQRQIKR